MLPLTLTFSCFCCSSSITQFHKQKTIISVLLSLNIKIDWVGRVHWHKYNLIHFVCIFHLSFTKSETVSQVCIEYKSANFLLSVSITITAANILVNYPSYYLKYNKKINKRTIFFFFFMRSTVEWSIFFPPMSFQKNLKVLLIVRFLKFVFSQIQSESWKIAWHH